MKLTSFLSQNLGSSASIFFPLRKYAFFCIIVLVGFNLPANAQINKNQPTWWFGVAGGANYNRYTGNTRSLNTDIHPAAGFNRGSGYGGYVAAVVEYHHKSGVWGLMLQQGADNRTGKFENAGNKLEAHLSYFTVEPSLVIMIPKTGFHIYAGPRFGFLWGSEFTFKEPNRPTYPDGIVNYPAYVENTNINPVSMQVGVGYNLKLNSGSASTQFVLAPFVTYLPSLNKSIRTLETLKLNTLRAGIVLKAGRVSKND